MGNRQLLCGECNRLKGADLYPLPWHRSYPLL